MTNVVIIGQGYVGLPLARGASRAGLSVVGFDKSESVVSGLNAGISHVDDIDAADLAEMRSLGYRASWDAGDLQAADVIVICVPTPLDSSGHPDLAAVLDSCEMISRYMSRGTLVILESTTYPGTTEELVRPILEHDGRLLDADFYLAFSPERIDPGRKDYGLENTPKVVGGVTEESTKQACEFYQRFIATVVPVSGSREAEMAKLLENTYRHVNIALVNEMAKFCNDLNVNLWEVIRAASTKPFGFQTFYPGPGVGGHCIPIDPNYLSFQVQRKLGYPFRFVELAEEVNNSMPRYVVDRAQQILNDGSLPLKGSRIVMLGITYKADIADQRESPAKPIARLLRQSGASVAYHDPYVLEWDIDGESIEREEDLDSAVASADLTILLQRHREYDVEHIAGVAKAMLNTRGAAHGGNTFSL